MKYSLRLTLTLFAVTALVAAALPGDKSGLDRLKSLVGTWKGADPNGNAVTVSYKLVSGDNTLMETLDMGEHKESMITVYHLDNDNVMCTHYCSMGNQPRMRLAKSAGDKLAFSFVDATNLKSKDAPHMHGLTFTLKDADHFSQEWTMRAEGKDNASVFNFERVK